MVVALRGGCVMRERPRTACDPHDFVASAPGSKNDGRGTAAMASAVRTAWSRDRRDGLGGQESAGRARMALPSQRSKKMRRSEVDRESPSRMRICSVRSGHLGDVVDVGLGVTVGHTRCPGGPTSTG